MKTLPVFVRSLYIFLRLFFYLLYNPFAWTYDLVANIVSLGMWKNWVVSVLPYLDGPYILEIGHGPGHLQKALRNKLPKAKCVCGLDLSRTMGRITRKRLVRGGIVPRLVNGRAQQLPFSKETFHQVVATFPAEYIIQPETFIEVWRVLKLGGAFVILPLAWITGQAIHERAAAGLFHITGQAPAWDERILEPIKKIGFQTKVEWITFKSSKLLVILADKPNLL